MKQSTSNKVIVIVEDDTAILQLYTLKLQSQGHEVIQAKNGVEGLEVIKEHNPDIILLDIMMPEMNGDEMLRILRTKSWGEDKKVVVLTNISKDEIPMGIRSLNVEDFLIKALYTPTQVMDRINKCLNN